MHTGRLTLTAAAAGPSDTVCKLVATSSSCMQPSSIAGLALLMAVDQHVQPAKSVAAGTATPTARGLHASTLDGLRNSLCCLLQQAASGCSPQAMARSSALLVNAVRSLQAPTASAPCAYSSPRMIAHERCCILTYGPAEARHCRASPAGILAEWPPPGWPPRRCC